VGVNFEPCRSTVVEFLALSAKCAQSHRAFGRDQLTTRSDMTEKGSREDCHSGIREQYDLVGILAGGLSRKLVRIRRTLPGWIVSRDEDDYVVKVVSCSGETRLVCKP